jgi:hypothetical protein
MFFVNHRAERGALLVLGKGADLNECSGDLASIRMQRSREASLPRINEAHSDHAQASDAGKEKVVAAAQANEIREIAADEGRVGRACVALYHESAATSMTANQGVFVIAEMCIIAILHPLLLYELELAREAGVERHENDSALLVVRHRVAFCSVIAIR